MATWRYTDVNSSEMAAASGTEPPVQHSAAAPPAKQVPDYFDEDNAEDLSFSDLDEFPEFLFERAPEIYSLHLDHNQMPSIPSDVGLFCNLINLDVSNNRLKSIANELCMLPQLRTLVARNNFLTSGSIPKDFGMMPSLAVLNLSGNHFTEVPMQFTELHELRCLYLGANRITSIPSEIKNLHRLEILYLGGNQLSSVPDELGSVSSLISLVLCDNRLESLPRSLINLHQLQSLSLHNNRLSTLPPEIIRLNLVELSLRNNPLVVRFVEEMTYEAPTLRELAGRVVKVNNVPYSADDLPASLVEYLDSAQSCVNPKCKGVYFTSRVEHIKFVDFCGKYRLPLMQYLCSPKCTSSSSSRIHTYLGMAPPPAAAAAAADDVQPVANRLKKVLLG